MNRQLSEDDVMRRLEWYRPEVRDDEWGPAQRAAVLRAALDNDHTSRSDHQPAMRRRRWLAVAGGIAAAAVAILAIELVPRGSTQQPGGSSTSAAPTTSSETSSAPSTTPPPEGPVARLADAARHTNLGNPQQGQFWYHRIDLYAPARDGAAAKITGATINWIAPNGDDWDASTGTDGRSCAYYKYVGSPNPNHANTAYLQALPTDPEALDRYLRAHVQGSNSTDQAVFVAISDTLNNVEGLVPPDLRAAFIEVLAQTPSVTVRSGVGYGDAQTATTFTYKDGESLWFDEATAQLVSKLGAPGYHIVDILPAWVADPATCPRGAN